MRKFILVAAVMAAVFGYSAGIGGGVAQAAVTQGTLFFDGGVVRTVVTPAATPNEGTDLFYAVTNGAAGQKGIAGVAPGSPGYRGGHWAVSTVTFKIGVTPYLLTSAAAVDAAVTAGKVTVTRVPAKDFLCPVQP